MFDGCIQLMLIVCFCICQMSWCDFVVFVDEVFQCFCVFVVDLFDVCSCEMVEFFVFEEWVLLLMMFVEFFISWVGYDFSFF